MDVKTTFLNGKIEEEVYIEKLEGFNTHDRKNQLSLPNGYSKLNMHHMEVLNNKRKDL